jgi:hypothetical protein
MVRGGHPSSAEGQASLCFFVLCFVLCVCVYFYFNFLNIGGKIVILEHTEFSTMLRVNQQWVVIWIHIHLMVFIRQLMTGIILDLSKGSLRYFLYS